MTNWKTLPKVEIHLHLEGSIRLATLHEISNQYGPKYGIIPMNLEEAREYFCIKQKTDSLTAFIQKFFNTQAFLLSYEIVERIAFEVVEDSFLNGVVLLEIRYSPDFVVETFTIDHSHMTMDGVQLAVLAGIKRAQEKYDIQVGLIGIFDRSRDVEHGQLMLQFFKKHINDFVGVDLANDEKYPLDPFEYAFKELKELGLGITIHAGEAGPAKNVLQAIQLGATRIGHGIRVLDDESIVALCKEKGITFEVCPISNSRTGVISDYRNHPIRQLMEQGLLVTINTDDYGIFDSSIVEEYELLETNFAVTKEEFNQFNMNALNASFLNQEIKDRVRVQYFQ
jgi:adenosine deaminase